MKSVGSFEAKTHLSRLLAEVERGESITITRNGIPVARLVPVRDDTPDRRGQVIERIKTLRKGRTLGGMKVRELIDKGRR
jgi:prevent-host-death family protein